MSAEANCIVQKLWSFWSYCTVLRNPGETMIDPACGTGGFLIAMFLNIVAYGHRPIGDPALCHEPAAP
jgi:hypothetical protein